MRQGTVIEQLCLGYLYFLKKIWCVCVHVHECEYVCVPAIIRLPLDTSELELRHLQCSVCHVCAVIQTLALTAEQILLTAEPGIFFP